MSLAHFYPFFHFLKRAIIALKPLLARSISIWYVCMVSCFASFCEECRRFIAAEVYPKQIRNDKSRFIGSCHFSLQSIHSNSPNCRQNLHFSGSHPHFCMEMMDHLRQRKPAGIPSWWCTKKMNNNYLISGRKCVEQRKVNPVEVPHFFRDRNTYNIYHTHTYLYIHMYTHIYIYYTYDHHEQIHRSAELVVIRSIATWCLPQLVVVSQLQAGQVGLFQL